MHFIMMMAMAAAQSPESSQEEKVSEDAQATDASTEMDNKEDKKAEQEAESEDASFRSSDCPSGTRIPSFDNPNVQREAEKIWLEKNLEHYLDLSQTIVIGEIAGHRSLIANQGRDLMVDVIVTERLRGDEVAVISLHVPYNTPFIPGCPETVPPSVVDGYKMIFFIDKHNMVLEGNALLYVEGGYAWRNKRPEVFLSPRTDRDWIANDPSIDYVMYEISKIKEAVETSNARQIFTSQPSTQKTPEVSQKKKWWQFRE